MHRATDWLKTGVLTAVLAGVAGGCGTQVATSSPSATTVEPSTVESLADETLAAIAGTAEEREAQHHTAFKELNQPYELCMRAQAIDFTAEYHTLFAGYEPNGTSGRWMGALHRKPSTQALANAAAFRDDRVGNVSAEEKSADFVAAKAKCDVETAGADQHVDLGEAGDANLQAEFTNMLDGVEEALGDIAPYTQCMREAGVEYTLDSNGEQGWAGLYLYLTAQLPLPPLPGQEPDEAWLRYLDVEHRALAADAECRGEKYAEGLALLGPKLLDFRERFASELQASHDTWAAELEQAQAPGFNP